MRKHTFNGRKQAMPISLRFFFLIRWEKCYAVSVLRFAYRYDVVCYVFNHRVSCSHYDIICYCHPGNTCTRTQSICYCLCLWVVHVIIPHFDAQCRRVSFSVEATKRCNKYMIYEGNFCAVEDNHFMVCKETFASVNVVAIVTEEG